MNKIRKNILLFVLCSIFLGACGYMPNELRGHSGEVLQGFSGEDGGNGEQLSLAQIQKQAFAAMPVDDLLPIAADALERSLIAQQIRRRYFFQRDEYEHKDYFAIQTEALFYAVNNLMAASGRPLGIFMADSREQIDIRRIHQLEINHDEVFGFGLTTYWLTQEFFFPNSQQITRGYLPFWLLSGIEAIARRNADIEIFNPISDEVIFFEDFGDLRFFPQLWGGDEHKQAINIAYHFTTHLMDNGFFDILIQMYLGNENRYADILARELFYGFSGRTLDTGIFLRFGMDGIYAIVLCQEFSITNFIFYNLDRQTNIDLTRARVAWERYGQIFDDGTRFVKEWFVRYVDWDSNRIIHNVFFDKKGVWVDGWRYAPATGGFGATHHYGGVQRNVIVHETVHAMEDQIAERNFTPFSEGLAEYLQARFLSLCPADRYHHHALQQHPYIANIGAWDHFGSRYRRDDENFIPYIASYTTSASFVTYLIETYGVEKYLQVHWDVDIFEYVYGICLDGMVNRWRIFLQEMY